MTLGFISTPQNISFKHEFGLSATFYRTPPLICNPRTIGGKNERWAMKNESSQENRFDKNGVHMSRRALLKATALAFLGSLPVVDSLLECASASAVEKDIEEKVFDFPPLPYSYSSLEPHIDEMTMKVHHDKHFAAYTNNLNSALSGPDGQKLIAKADLDSLKDLLSKLDSIDDKKKKSMIRNNGGGYINHLIFFQGMKGGQGSDVKPSGTLKIASAIKREYGDLDSFQKEFKSVALTQFGSGWAWAYKEKTTGKLKIGGYPNQDSPFMQGHIPILGIDVWEHAYYLKYQNRRAEYIDAWWNVVDWEAAEKLYLTQV